MTVQELIQHLKTLQNAVICIEGRSGSGKSTLASELEVALDATVFHTDDYFLPAIRKTPERLNMPGGNLDWERMKEEVFDHLSEAYITSNHYDCSIETLQVRQSVVRKPYIIIEGVYSMLPVFESYYDIVIFLDVDAKTQKQRILQRSNERMLQRFVSEWIPLEEVYFKAFSIREKADFILPFTQKKS